MKTPTHHSMGTRMERTIIAFFILAATSLLVVYVADPAIYTQSLSLTSSKTLARAAHGRLETALEFLHTERSTSQ
jgi:hypothetical protein